MLWLLDTVQNVWITDIVQQSCDDSSNTADESLIASGFDECL